MDSSTPTLSPDDVEIQPAATPSLSSDDVEVVGAPKPQQASPAGPAQPKPTATVGAAPPQGWFASARESVANSPVGRTLETYAPSVAKATGLEPTESDTAREQDIQDSGKWAEWHPVQGAKTAVQGVKDLAESGAIGAAPSVPGTMAPPIPQKADVDQAAKGATELMSGGMEATKPLMVAGIAAAPFRSAALYAAGIAAGKGAQVTAKAMGATPNEQEFFHTLGFFLPDTMVKAAGVEAFTEKQGSTDRAGMSALGGKVGFVAARNPEAVGVAGNVGGTRFAWAKNRDKGVNFSDQAPTGLPGAQGGEQAPPPPPDPVAVQRQEQVAKTTDIASQAAKTNAAAAAAAGLQPTAPPPPKPGEPGSKEAPLPAGMADGALTPETAENVGKGIQALPPQLKAKGIIETVTNLAKWVAGKGTIVGPDNKLHQVTGQSPQAQDQSARTIATKLVNDEVDKQNQQAQQAQDDQEKLQKSSRKRLKRTPKPRRKRKRLLLRERAKPRPRRRRKPKRLRWRFRIRLRFKWHGKP